MIFILFLCLLVGVEILKAQSEKEEISSSDQKLLEQYEQQAQNLIQKGDLNEATRYINKKAFLYWEKEALPQAVLHFKKSLEINEKIGNRNAITMIYNNLGMIHSDMKAYDEALQYFDKTLEWRKKARERAGIASALLNMAVIHGNKNQHQTAIPLLLEALENARELNDNRLMRSCYAMLSESYQKTGNAEKSIEYFRFYTTLENLLREEDSRKQRQQMAEIELQAKLSEVEKRNKELELLNAERLLKSSDSAKNELKKRNSEKESTIDALTQEKALQDLIVKEQQAKLEYDAFINKTFVAGFAIVAIFIVLLIFGYKQKQKANAELAFRNDEILKQQEEILAQRDQVKAKTDALEVAFEEIKEKNFKITGSINYAKRIQEAILRRPQEFLDAFEDSFLFFQPRDIVSGDFYWFLEVDYLPIFRKKVIPEFSSPQSVFSHFQSKKIIFSAIDCTGHGVPGAFMSMIGVNLLNEIVSRGIHEPDLILNELHRGVRKTLDQDSTENRDGMDMCLCTYHRYENELHFAGAKNSLVYIKNGVLEVVKGDKYPIGGRVLGEKRVFTRTIIPIDCPTYVYIFTDGFQDQFGGEDGRKFMIKQLKELLLKCHTLPMNVQKEILQERFNEWMGDTHRQIDDVLLMGVRLTPTKQ